MARRGGPRLCAWRALTDQGRHLRGVVQQFGLSRGPFDALIEGVEMDLERTRYETCEELLEYCRRVASAVGLMCIEIFGCRGPEAREYAVELGLALQLTNIIRDVKDDLERGRVYLPMDDLRRFGCTEADLQAGRVTEPVRRLLAFECARAREHYARAAAALPLSSVRKLVAAEIMGGIYFEILQRIERGGYDVFSRRVRVPKPARALIALTIWMRSRIGLAGLRLGPAPRA
ncbi:MAG: phytoene/squalene synthase family protein [Vicinamibacterales bacterium]